MKSLTFFPFHLTVLASLFLFSCTREVNNETTSVKLSFPSSQSVQKFSSNLTSLSDTASLAEDGLSSTNEFAPEPTVSGEYPYTCYLVAVSYPEEGANKNYCGKKDTTTAVAAAQSPTLAPATPIIADDVSLKPTFYFSQNFVGLIDPTISSSVELSDIFIGPQRTFTILAVPTTDRAACQNLLNQPFSKSIMLRPRKVAEVTADLQVTNEPLNIAVKPAYEYFDDCIIVDTKLNYPDVQKTVIEQDTFPFNYMRGFSGEANGYVCQPVNVGLRAAVGENGREVPAALNFDGEFEIKQSVGGATPARVKTFNTHGNCINSNNSAETFIFQRNQPLKRRWVQVSDVPGREVSFTAESVDSKPEVTTYTASTFILAGKTTNILDHHVPRVLQLNTCYKVSTSVRNIYGVRTPLSGQGINLYNTVNNLKLFTDASDCNSGLNAVSSISFSAGTYAVEYWIKAKSLYFSAGSSINFKMYLSNEAGTTSAPYMTTVPLYTSVDAQSAQLSAQGDQLDISNIGSAKSYPQLSIPNEAGGCYPITVHINNRLGATYADLPDISSSFKFLLKDGSPSYFENVPLRYQPVDLAKDANTGGYIIHHGAGVNHLNPCQYPTEPISVSSTVVTGTPMMMSNGTNYTLFIQTLNDGSAGRRRLQLYYGGSSTSATIGYPVGQIDFELTVPD